MKKWAKGEPCQQEYANLLLERLKQTPITAFMAWGSEGCRERLKALLEKEDLVIEKATYEDVAKLIFNMMHPKENVSSMKKVSLDYGTDFLFELGLIFMSLY